MTRLAGHLVLPDRVLPGTIRFGGTIGEIAATTAVPDRFVLPGFVDVHVHGGGGGDVIDGPGGIEILARFHLGHGTTTLLPTTITRPWQEVTNMLRAVAEVRRAALPDGPEVAGAHLEGPFLSPGRLGAQPPFAIPPTTALLQEVLAPDVVRVATLAPEIEGADAAIDAFARAGVRISLGHSNAGFDVAARALARIASAGGVAGATHLFNAMDGIAGRAPGLVGAILNHHAAHAELILDTHHVHPASFTLARNALGDRLLLVTDAIRATGLGDGPSELGGRPVSIRNGVARLSDGTLAGSVLTMDAALRHALDAGSSLPQAARLTSTNACAYLGLNDRGRLTPGLRADLVVLDPAMQPLEVWAAGRRVA